MATITISLDGVEPALAADLARIAAGRPGPLLLGEVLELQARAEDIRLAMLGGTRSGTGAGLLGRSVRVGNIVLRSVSLGGTIALRRLVLWAPVLDQTSYDILEAWIYAHSWSAEQLSRLTDPTAAEEIVAEWAPQLTCAIEEIKSAISALVEPPEAANQPSAGPSRQQDHDPACVLESLMIRYPGSSEVHWLETPVARINAISAAAASNDRARDAEVARQSGKLPPAARDERVNAVARYARTRSKLLKGEAKADG